MRVPKCRVLRSGVAILLASLITITPLLGSDGLERLRKAVIDNSNGRLSQGQFTGATRGGIPRSYGRARFSFRTGGVLVGRPADGAVTKLSVPHFEYEIDKSGDTVEVNLQFRSGTGESWEIRVPAGVIHPATAMAVEGGVVVYTLTAPTDEDSDDAETLPESLAFSSARVSGGDDGVAVNPTLEDHRIAWLPAVLDLYADNRAGTDLSRELLGLNVVISAITSVLVGYEELATKSGGDTDGDEKSRVLATLLAENFQGYQLGKQILESAGEYDLSRCLAGAVPASVVKDVEDLFHAMSGFYETTSKALEATDENRESLEFEQQLSSFRLSATLSAALEKEAWNDPITYAGQLLSVVEEREWTLSPAGFSSPEDPDDLDDFAFSFVHRYAVEDIDAVAEEDLQRLDLIPGLAMRVGAGIEKQLERGDWEIMEEYNDFLIVQRLVRAIVAGQVTDFPVGKWEELLKDTNECDVSNHRKVGLASLKERSVRWHQATELHQKDSEMIPSPPTIPASIRLK